MKVIVVSPFPSKPGQNTRVGLEWCTKAILGSLAASNLEFMVLNEDIAESISYTQGNVKVMPTWKKGVNPWKSVRRQVNRYYRVGDVLHVHQEFFGYGGYFSALKLPLLLRWAKHQKIRTIVSVHGVISQTAINTAFVQENGSKLPTWIIRLAFALVYRLISRYSDTIIVHDNSMAQILEKEYWAKSRQVKVIPLPLEVPLEKPMRSLSREKFGLSIKDKVLLFFGYVVGYKGLEDLLTVIPEVCEQVPRLKLLVAGGRNPKKLGDKTYLSYYTKLFEQAKSINESLGTEVVKWIGFVDTQDIPELITASDLFVLPYRYKLASSGPMSFALGYGKAFLASKVFKSELPKDLVYGDSRQDLAGGLISAFSKDRQTELEKTVSSMQSALSMENLAKAYLAVYLP